MVGKKKAKQKKKESRIEKGWVGQQSLALEQEWEIQYGSQLLLNRSA